MDSITKTPPEEEFAQKSQQVAEVESTAERSRTDISRHEKPKHNSDRPLDVAVQAIAETAALAATAKVKDPTLVEHKRPQVQDSKPRKAEAQDKIITEPAIPKARLKSPEARSNLLSNAREQKVHTKEAQKVPALGLPLEIDTDYTPQLMSYDEEHLEVYAKDPLEQPSDTSQETYTTTTSVWGAELAKDEVEIYGDFTEALSALLELNQAVYVGTENINHGNEAPEDEDTLPIVTIQVAEKLQLLDDAGKEIVAPILKDIVGAVHGILLLEESEANHELIQEVEERLKVFCTLLFEALGIDYEESDIKHFASVLLRPDFKPASLVKTSDRQIEPTDEGTHEIKNFDTTVSNGYIIYSQPHQILGMLMLLSIRLRSEVR